MYKRPPEIRRKVQRSDKHRRVQMSDWYIWFDWFWIELIWIMILTMILVFVARHSFVTRLWKYFDRIQFASSSSTKDFLRLRIFKREHCGNLKIFILFLKKNNFLSFVLVWHLYWSDVCTGPTFVLVWHLYWSDVCTVRRLYQSSAIVGHLRRSGGGVTGFCHSLLF